MGAKKQKIKHHKTAQGFSSVGAFVFVGVVFVGIMYLFSSNNIAIKGDRIYSIEKDIKTLASENEQLVIQEAQLRSLEDIEKVIEEKKMMEVESPVYIEREVRVALD